MAYDIKIIDIMKDIGCGDGFHIPVANEENQLLEKEIEELLKKKAELLVIEESLDNDLRDHKNAITNFSIEESQNQKLIIANRQQYDTEKQMLIAAQRDNDNLSRENKDAAKKYSELIEDQNKLKNELAKHDEDISKMRETIEWGEETLLAWNNDLAKQNTNVNLLEAYHLEDNKRFKELDLRRQQLQKDVIERESIVEKEVSELLRVERELEQTSKLTRQAQQERNHLLEQWENAANVFNSNKKYTQNIIEEINEIREVAREIYKEMNENKQKYQDYLEVNEELEYEINEGHKVVNELNLMILKKQAENDNLQSEVTAAQTSLNKVDNALADERTKRKHMKSEQDKLKKQLEEKEKTIITLKNDLSKVQNESMTTEERLNELNKIYEKQEALTEHLISEKNKVLNLTFNVKNEINQLHSKIDILKNELDQCHNKQIMLSKEETKLKQSIMEKKEVLYTLSFQLEMVRMKIAETEGTMDIEMMHDLQEKLQKLNKELSQAKDDQIQLQKRLKSTEDESRRLIKDIEKNSVDLKTQQNRLEELNIINERGEKQIQQLKEQNHRYHMEEMMVNLKVEQMKKLTHNECEKVYSLAQQREELAADINKRKAELAAVHEQINTEKKMLLDEKSSVKRRLDNLIQYIEQRKNKYSILSVTLGSVEGSDNYSDDDGDDGEDDRISFKISEHRIRLTREKLELQEMGDELDERVQKMETEIRAMENTLHVLNASNSCYKSSLSSINTASDEYKDKIVLEETYEKLNSMWLQKKKSVEKIENEIRSLEVQYKMKNEELESLINFRSIKESELESVLKESNEQMLKLNRANSRIQFDMKQIDKNCDPDKRSALELIKRDIQVRMKKKVNKNVLELLSEMSVRHIGVEPTIKQYLSEKGLQLPIVSGLMLNKLKSSCNSSNVSLISTNSSIKSYSDEDRRSLYSTMNLESTTKDYTRKSGTLNVNK